MCFGKSTYIIITSLHFSLSKMHIPAHATFTLLFSKLFQSCFLYLILNYWKLIIFLLLVLFAQLYPNSLNIPRDLHLVCTVNSASSLFIALSTTHFSSHCHVFAVAICLLHNYISLKNLSVLTWVADGEFFLLVCSQVYLLSKKKEKLPEVITSS